MEEQFKIEWNEILIKFLLGEINFDECIEELCKIIDAAVQYGVTFDEVRT